MSDQTPSRTARVGAMMWNLRIDAATGECVEALRRRGIDSVVLKGPALAGWYAPDSSRTYVDGDIWVAPERIPDAEQVLEELGFIATMDKRGLPEWWQEHASSWFRERDRGSIDLHRRLQGTGAEPARTWSLLWPRAVRLNVGGVDAHCLDETARVLYVTLHATHHGSSHGGGLPHLMAALESVEDGQWREAAELAEAVDALDGFSTGLRLVPAGAALAKRLDLPEVTSVRSALYGSSPPPVALGLEQIASARGWRRIEIVLRKFFPPPGFVRHWWPPAAKNGPMLLMGYFYRPLWLLKRTPAGYRAWRAARRAASRPS